MGHGRPHCRTPLYHEETRVDRDRGVCVTFSETPPNSTRSSGAFNSDNPRRLQLDGLYFGHEPSGIAAQERGDNAKHGVTEAADNQNARSVRPRLGARPWCAVH